MKYREILAGVLVMLLIPLTVLPQVSVSSGTYLVNSGTIVLNDLGITNSGTLNSTGGTIVFTGASNSTISGAGTFTIYNITVNKSTNSSGVVLNCNLTLTGTLTLTSGDFDIYNKILTLGSTALISGETNNNLIISTASENKGTVTATRDLSGPITNYTFGNIGITVTTAATLGSTTVTRMFTPVIVEQDTGIARCFTIIPTNNSDLNATLVLRYFGNEIISDLDPDNMILFLSTDNGLTFSEVTATNSWDSELKTGTLTVTGLSTFGPNNIWTSTDDEHPLPIVLESFTSTVDNRDVTLCWITSQENNNQGFDIEKFDLSDSDSLWRKAGYIKGQGTKHSPTEYIFKEQKLNSGKYKYRLKQTDYNGNFEYYELGNTVEVALPKSFELGQNYPNPFNAQTKIDFALPENSKVNIIIFDILGREIRTPVNQELKAGYYTILMNTNDLASGTYFYRITAGKFVKTLKMVMVK